MSTPPATSSSPVSAIPAATNSVIAGSPVPTPDPTVYVKSAIFSDGSRLEFVPNDIVVFVGPNNAGKSQALRDLRGLAENASFVSLVAKQIELALAGTREDLEKYVRDRGKQEKSSGDYLYHVNGAQINSSWSGMWDDAKRGLALRNLARLFFLHLDVQSRLSAADTVESFARMSGHPSLPTHYLYLFPTREEAIAAAFKQAFGKGLVINRSAGREIPILFGDCPPKSAGEEEHSESFQKKLSELSLVSSQGDGMKCFAGILLNVIATPTNVLLIDEPEAFLHPPQARILGRFLATHRQAGTQLFISTHSSDLLRGLLDANTGRVTVVRLTRDGNVNHVSRLDNANISQFWRDPLLRFSNVLDGLFHDKVVIAEADGDCRFFAAIGDSTASANAGSPRDPDVLYTPTFGKDRILVIVKALRAIRVPTFVVSDFDFMNSSKRVEDVYSALGGNDWARLLPLLKQVAQAVESTKKNLDATLLVPFIDEVLKRNTTSVFSPADADEIRKRLKSDSPWDDFKRVGMVGLPGGVVFNACDQLLSSLEEIGLFVLRKGELESFDPTIGKHGPAWVLDALSKNLGADPAFADARKFVRSMISWKSP